MFDTYVRCTGAGGSRERWIPTATLGGFNHFNSLSLSEDTLARSGGEYYASIGITERRNRRRWVSVAGWRPGFDVCCSPAATIGGDIVAVSARESGHLLLHARHEGGRDKWGQVGAFNVGFYPGFYGLPVGITGNTVLVGTYLDNTVDGFGAGAVRVYAVTQQR